MTTDELMEAYGRFRPEGMTGETLELLDAVATALSAWFEHSRDGSFIGANRVCAMLAIERAEEWQKAEWEAA